MTKQTRNKYNSKFKYAENHAKGRTNRSLKEGGRAVNICKKVKQVKLKQGKKAATAEPSTPRPHSSNKNISSVKIKRAKITSIVRKTMAKRHPQNSSATAPVTETETPTAAQAQPQAAVSPETLDQTFVGSYRRFSRRRPQATVQKFQKKTQDLREESTLQKHRNCWRSVAGP